MNRTRHKDFTNNDYVRELYMKHVQSNKEDTIEFCTNQSICLINNRGTDCGGLRNEAIHRFSFNFMRKWSGKNHSTIESVNKTYYIISSNTSFEDRLAATKDFY